MFEPLPWHRAALTELTARRNTFPHALLIHGRRGIGKHEFARALAQSLLCEAPVSGLACGNCPACHWYDEGNHPDLRELQPAADVEVDAAELEDVDEAKKKSKEIRIDQIRGVADFMSLSTHRGGFRVLLIHPAESMNAAAANALLKTLEEPPPLSVILLVADQVARLPATIRSRCQRVNVPWPSATDAEAWLAAQGVSAATLAMAGGAPLDALDLAQPARQENRSAVVSVLADPALDYLAAAQAWEKIELPEVLLWMQTWLVDLVLTRLGCAPRFYRDQKTALSQIAARAELPKLFRLDTELRQQRRSINHPLNARLLLEQLLISYKLATKPSP